MARYRGKKAVEGLTFLIIIVVVIALIVLKFAITIALLLLPIFILVIFSYYYYLKKRNQHTFENAKQSIWCSPIELQEIKEISEIINEATEKIELANNQANSEELSRNADGSISLRSKRGKELTNIISENQFIIYNNKDKFYQLRELPIIRWNNLLLIETRLKALAYSLMTYIISLPILSLIFLKSISISSIQKILLYPSKMFEPKNSNSPEAKAMWILLLLTLLSLLIGFIIAKREFNNTIKKPKQA